VSEADGGSAIFARGMLDGRAALVTGGGTGLGRATALELARCGASVTIAGRREDVLQQAAAEIGDLTGEGVHVVAGDVRDAADARRVVGEALGRMRGLDTLINNAGGQFFSPAELIVAKGWNAVWRLNVDGMLNMAEAAYELAFARGDAEREDDDRAGARAETGAGKGAGADTGAGKNTPAGAGAGANTAAGTNTGAGAGAGAGGTIVNVTLSPHHGMPGMAHSGAARAAVEALTRELAERWGPGGVTVTAVAAGTYDTEVMVKYPANVRAGMSRSVPLQRLGQPEEHAWLVALLCSPLAAAMNGSTITLDGARDNWFGPWPPPGLVDEQGAVPVEERR
jgi:citronellol/citronellal dehydrogenase